MNKKLRQIVQKLERQGYRFSFDEDTPDEVVEATLDIVSADSEDDFNDVDDACGRHPPSAPGTRRGNSRRR